MAFILIFGLLAVIVTCQLKIYYHIKTIKSFRGLKFRGPLELVTIGLPQFIAYGLLFFPLIGNKNKESRIANKLLFLLYLEILLLFYATKYIAP